MPGMDCTVNGIAHYVSCYGSAIGNKEEADRRVIRLIDELRVVLPSDGWRGMETAPGIDSIRSYTYEDQNSDAHIDIDLITITEMEGEPSYRVAIYGWPRDRATIVTPIIALSISAADISAFAGLGVV